MWSKSLEILNPYDEVCKSLEKENAQKPERKTQAILQKFLKWVTAR